MRIPRFYVATMAVLMVTMPGTSLAQQNSGAADVPAQAAVYHSYKLNFALRETDQGKIVNQRAFSLSASLSASRMNDAERSSLRAGTRLPITGEKGIEYIDIGTNLDVDRIKEASDGLQMFLSAQISSIPADNPATTGPTPIRQVKASASVLAPLNKPTVVFTADDPVSKHRFELEVTAVREH